MCVDTASAEEMRSDRIEEIKVSFFFFFFLLYTHFDFVDSEYSEANFSGWKLDAPMCVCVCTWELLLKKKEEEEETTIRCVYTSREMERRKLGTKERPIEIQGLLLRYIL